LPTVGKASMHQLTRAVPGVRTSRRAR
jgi:hypothetical protein